MKEREDRELEEAKREAKIISATQKEQLRTYRERKVEHSIQEKMEGELILSKARSDIAEEKAKQEDYKRRCRQDNLEMHLV